MISDRITSYFKDFYQKYIKKNAWLIWAFIFAMLSFVISGNLFFDKNPFLGANYLGQYIFAVAVFLLVYYYGNDIIRGLGSWIDQVLFNTMTRALQSVLKSQSRKSDEEDKDKKEASISRNVKGIVFDTSAIIDGRIFSVIETGFLDNDVIVTQNVIDELKYMADRKDSLKRQKGRQGLDKLKSIRKKLGKKRFHLIDLKTNPEKVDDSLVEYCKLHKYKIATVDYNLNKAAQVAGVEVLNVNKLANEIKTKLLPGDILRIKLMQKGKEEGQAVGYLEDGTMIVVSSAKDCVGKEKDVLVEKVLQTSAGKMIFASLSEIEIVAETK